MIRGVGGIEHAKFRAFANERRGGNMTNFVDGDLIEQVRSAIHVDEGPGICLQQNLHDAHLGRQHHHRRTDFGSDRIGFAKQHGSKITSVVDGTPIIRCGPCWFHVEGGSRAA